MSTAPLSTSQSPSQSQPSDADPVVPGFADLGVPRRLVEALSRLGIDAPFPIQTATLPDALAGRDVLGRGATGSGKSLAFLIPIVARLAAAPRAPQARRPRALVLAPTRELATQLDEALAPLAKAAGVSHMTIFGGVGMGPQTQRLQRGVDVVIACPGRLVDHLGGGRADLSQIEITVLDEADHMADLGFLPDVRRILDRTPAGTQRLLFSATLDAGVDVLVKRYLSEPVVHEVESARAETEGRIDHRVIRVERETRLATITDLARTPGRVVVFTRTKHGARKLARQLAKNGVSAVDLHGDLSQGARRRNLDAFSSGRADTLVATDIAARGIHVDDVALVVHADPPADHKAYVHRSGRTARAGASGSVVTLAMDDQLADVAAMTRKADVKPTHDGVLDGFERQSGSTGRSRSKGQSSNQQSGQKKQGQKQGQRQGGGQPSGGRRSTTAGGEGQQNAGGSRRRRPQGRPQTRTQTPAGSGGHSAASFSSSRRGR